MLHQYIRQQANELAAARAGGYYPPFIGPPMPRGGQSIQNAQPRDDTRPMRNVSRGEGKPSPPERTDRPRDQESALPKGWREQFGLPSGGGSGPPPGGGGEVNDGEPEEEEGDETDEDTISVTDSSTPGDPGRGDGAGGPPEGGDPPGDPDGYPGRRWDYLGEDLVDIEVRGEEQGHLVGKAHQALWDQ